MEWKSNLSKSEFERRRAKYANEALEYAKRNTKDKIHGQEHNTQKKQEEHTEMPAEKTAEHQPPDKPSPLSSAANVVKTVAEDGIAGALRKGAVTVAEVAISEGAKLAASAIEKKIEKVRGKIESAKPEIIEGHLQKPLIEFDDIPYTENKDDTISVSEQIKIKAEIPLAEKKTEQEEIVPTELPGMPESQTVSENSSQNEEPEIYPENCRSRVQEEITEKDCANVQKTQTACPICQAPVQTCGKAECGTANERTSTVPPNLNDYIIRHNNRQRKSHPANQAVPLRRKPRLTQNPPGHRKDSR